MKIRCNGLIDDGFPPSDTNTCTHTDGEYCKLSEVTMGQYQNKIICKSYHPKREAEFQGEWGLPDRENSVPPAEQSYREEWGIRM